MYKDAYGFRPRGIDTTGWTLEDFDKEFKILAQVIDYEEARRRESEAEASHAFELRMQNLLLCGAKDRAQALKWVHEAENTDGDDDYLCYTLGLPYGYFMVDNR
jgi:hypothetical protein